MGAFARPAERYPRVKPRPRLSVEVLTHNEQVSDLPAEYPIERSKFALLPLIQGGAADADKRHLLGCIERPCLGQAPKRAQRCGMSVGKVPAHQ